MPFSVFLQSKIPKYLIFYLEMSLNRTLPFIHWPPHPHTVGSGGGQWFRTMVICLHSEQVTVKTILFD